MEVLRQKHLNKGLARSSFQEGRVAPGHKIFHKELQPPPSEYN